MNIGDYIIAQEGLDWATMLEDWGWVLPPSFEVWIVSRFADLFIVQDDGSVWMLDTSAGSFTRIADSRDHFAALGDDADTFSNWFMVGAVDEMVAAGHILGRGQCYSYRLPPGLGGDYVLSNFMVTDLHVHFSIHGQIFRHTKDLPDGTPLRIKLK
jgi:hypothetical protein